MPIKGFIDGLDLTQFRAGNVYDVSSALATYLMASSYAMPVADEKPARVTPLDEDAPAERPGQDTRQTKLR